MRKAYKIMAVVLLLTTAGSLWATTIPTDQLASEPEDIPDSDERIVPYQARLERGRPVVAIVGDNRGTELTDFVIPYGILARANVAELVTVSTKPGVMKMRPALQLQPDTTLAGFDARYPDGADYVVVPMIVKYKDPELKSWLRRQSAKGATMVSICDGALVVANAGLMDGHRGTAHWATLGHRRDHYPKVQWIENRRFVADRTIVSSAGISASVPTSLALVEAIGGRDRALQVASMMEVKDWSSRHNSQVFSIRHARNLTALAATSVIQPALRKQQSIGIPIKGGIDEVALAFAADAYSRTGRSQAFAVAQSAEPVTTENGLTFLPDWIKGQGPAVDHFVEIQSVPPGAQLDAVLASISKDYGRLVAFSVALQLEYPAFE